jgi:hypothetical protein
VRDADRLARGGGADHQTGGLQDAVTMGSLDASIDGVRQPEIICGKGDGLGGPGGDGGGSHPQRLPGAGE